MMYLNMLHFEFERIRFRLIYNCLHSLHSYQIPLSLNIKKNLITSCEFFWMQFNG